MVRAETGGNDPQRRVLILAPTGRDAELARDILCGEGLDCHVCHGADQLCQQIRLGAGACVITEEACDPVSVELLASCLSGQPPWSDLPILLLTRGGGRTVDSPIVLQAVELLRNVLLLERPTRVGTLLSLVRSALRARERQYHTRQHLAELERTSRTLGELTRGLAASNDELRDFAYVASHDLKEPLRGIATYAHMLLEDYGPSMDQPGRERLEALVRLPKRMFSLLDGLLEYSRLGRLDLRREEIDPAQAAESAVEALRPWLAGRHATVEIERPLPHILGDASLIERVFTNLFANGVKYNLSERPRITVSASGGALLVADNGIGIPARHHETVFRMFKRLHGRDAFGGGTGAGLAIVRKIVEKHGATIAVESQEGRGTTFVLRFPALREGPANGRTTGAAHPDHAPSDEGPPARAGARRNTELAPGLRTGGPSHADNPAA
jgi:signal transduction histidine kinase